MCGELATQGVHAVFCRQPASAVADDVGDGLGVGPFHARRAKPVGGGHCVEYFARAACPMTNDIMIVVKRRGVCR